MVASVHNDRQVADDKIGAVQARERELSRLQKDLAAEKESVLLTLKSEREKFESEKSRAEQSLSQMQTKEAGLRAELGKLAPHPATSAQRDAEIERFVASGQSLHSYRLTY